jgi:hypothetical protein
VIDQNNLAPAGFQTALSECLEFLSFEVDTNVPIYIDRINLETSGLAWNGVEFVNGQFQMIIKLFADGIEANVRYNRLHYWLFVTIHEFAHIYFREISPQNAICDMEDKCSTLAHEAIQRYKSRSS